MMRTVRFIPLLLAAALCSCSTGRQSYAADTDLKSWNSAAEIVVPNTDTTTLRDISVFIYHTDTFREDSLTLRITTTTPDSLRRTEYLQLVTRRHRSAAMSGEQAAVYRREAVFNKKGNYTMTITPVRSVKGVAATGVQLSKSE